jgi:hypothetical protein
MTVWNSEYAIHMMSTYLTALIGVLKCPIGYFSYMLY